MKYAPTTLEIARREITQLVDIYMKATGFPKTFCFILATSGEGRSGNPKFGLEYTTREFGHSIYDRFNSRMSGLWPKDLPWPAEIPRQAPAKIDKASLASIAERLHAAAAAPKIKGWPAGQKWPADIPRPDGL